MEVSARRREGKPARPHLRSRRPPGPNLVQLARLVATRRSNSYELLPAVTQRYGDIANIPVPLRGSTMTLLGHPDHVNHVMIRHHGRYGRFRMVQELVVGEPGAIPLLEGDEWRRWRQSLNPYFGERPLAALSPLMAEAVTAGVDEWAANPATRTWFDLEHELGRVVMDALMRSMFSTALGPDTLNSYVTSAREMGRYTIIRAMTSSLPDCVPRPFQRRGEAAQQLLFRILDTLISARMNDGARDTPDILDALMSMPFDGSPLSQYRRLRTELSSLVFAGFETTAEAVAWTIALLHRNPPSLVQAQDEVDALGGRLIDYSSLERLPYLRACMDEALRIQAPPAIIRTASQDDEIGGYVLPAGSHVLISPYGLHRDGRFWTHPEQFDPRRFLTGAVHRNAYLPFNIGPRKCLGWRLAYIDGLMTVATILQRYTIELQPGWVPRPKLRISTALVGGLPARLTVR